MDHTKSYQLFKLKLVIKKCKKGCTEPDSIHNWSFIIEPQARLALFFMPHIRGETLRAVVTSCIACQLTRPGVRQSNHARKPNWSNGVDQTSSSCAAHSHTVTASWATISHTISGATRELGPLKGQSGGGEKSLCDTPQRIRQRDFLGFSQKQQTAHRTPACFYCISQGLGCQWVYSQMYIIHTRRHAGRAPGLVLQPLKIQRRGSREREGWMLRAWPCQRAAFASAGLPLRQSGCGLGPNWFFSR